MKLKEIQTKIEGFIPLQQLEIKSSNFKNFSIIFVICLVEILLLLLLLPLIFETKDDANMNRIVSGMITSKPSEFIIFSNILIGKVLKFLYINIQNVNWYVWYLLFSFFIGYTGILYSFSKIKSQLWVKIVRHLLIFSVFCFTLLILQFTRIATVSIISGYILILFSNNDRKKYYEIILGVFLIVLGSTIRFYVFLMCFALFIPFILFLLKKEQRFKLFYITIALLFSIGLNIYSKQYYANTPEFKEYLEFKSLRAKITTHDTPDFTYANQKELVKKIGWTKKDFDVATHFNLDVGHPKFSKENLLFLTSNSKFSISKLNFKYVISNINKTLNDLLIFLKNKYYYFFYLFLILLHIEKKWKELFLVLMSFIYIAGIAVFVSLVMEGNLKSRVIFGLVLPIFLLVIYFLDLKIFVDFIKLKFSKFKLANQKLIKIAI